MFGFDKRLISWYNVSTMDTIMNWLTIPQAEKESGYHPNYIRKLARRGAITGHKVGPTWLIDPDSLADYTKQMQSNGDPRSGPRRIRD